MPALFRLYGKDRNKCPGAKRFVAAEKGFTLVECLAALTLACLLLGMVWGFYLFGLNIFNGTAERVDLQQNVRVAADFIARELRYASTVQLRNSGEIAYRLPGDNTSYTIRHQNNEIVQFISSTEVKVAYNIHSVVFSWNAGNGMINFYLLGRNGDNEYAVNTALRLHNLQQSH